MVRLAGKGKVSGVRTYPEELKLQAVQMLLEGHSASSVVERLGISGTNLLYRWKKELVGKRGQTASLLDERVRELEKELQRVEWNE